MKNTIDFFHSNPAASHASLLITDEAEACAAVLIACLRANELDTDEDNAAFYRIRRRISLILLLLPTIAPGASATGNKVTFT